jgi:hypothetical protein
MLCDVFNVLPSVRELGNFNADDIDAVIKVFAKPPLSDRLRQVDMSCGNDPDIDFLRFGRADAFNGFLLQEAEQVDLHIERHVSDFIEKKRSALCCFDASDLTLVRSGECPFFITKSSDWNSCGAIAPQFTATNGACRRSDWRWIDSAAISLPVPDGPVIITEASVRATFCI